MHPSKSKLSSVTTTGTLPRPIWGENTHQKSASYMKYPWRMLSHKLKIWVELSSHDIKILFSSPLLHIKIQAFCHYMSKHVRVHGKNPGHEYKGFINFYINICYFEKYFYKKYFYFWALCYITNINIVTYITHYKTWNALYIEEIMKIGTQNDRFLTF